MGREMLAGLRVDARGGRRIIRAVKCKRCVFYS